MLTECPLSIIYIDSLAVYSKNLTEPIGHVILCQICNCLKAANLKIKAKKCNVAYMWFTQAMWVWLGQLVKRGRMLDFTMHNEVMGGSIPLSLISHSEITQY